MFKVLSFHEQKYTVFEGPEPLSNPVSLVLLPQVGVLLDFSQLLQDAFRLRVSHYNHPVVPLVAEHMIHIIHVLERSLHLPLTILTAEIHTEIH